MVQRPTDLERQSRRRAPAMTGGEILSSISGWIVAEQSRRSNAGEVATAQHWVYQGLSSASRLRLDWLADVVVKTGQDLARVGRQLSTIGVDLQRAGETAERLGQLLSQ